MKPKPKFPPSTEEKETIITLAASGMSQTKIAQAVGRSRGMVKHVIAEPEIQRQVQDEKAVLAEIYRGKARRIVESIGEEDIAKASLQQKSISSGVLLDKSLLLTGDIPPIRVEILLQAVDAIRAQREQENARFRAEFAAAHTLPAPGNEQAQ
jgi:hypothetical protein